MPVSQGGRRQVNALKALPFINAKRNVIMIGPTGTGKTHLAMAIGNQCCDNNMKAYFIKMGELKDRFHAAILAERQGRYLNGLSKYSCLIIDEIGYCRFDKAETLMFFQLIDRINLKEGTLNRLHDISSFEYLRVAESTVRFPPEILREVGNLAVHHLIESDSETIRLFRDKRGTIGACHLSGESLRGKAVGVNLAGCRKCGKNA